MNFTEQPKTDFVCKRCGQCCYYLNHEGKLLKCPQLIQISTKISMCRIYKHRIGYKITEQLSCGFRYMIDYDYEGCPYNTGKPMFTYNTNNTNKR